ncbi:MAG: hypothetical protein RL095_3101 [Verrucomicrobiota bacterium]|jgi:hypothetical protein
MKTLILLLSSLFLLSAAAPDAAPLSPASEVKPELSPPPAKIYLPGTEIPPPTSKMQGRRLFGRLGLISLYGGSVKGQRNLDTALEWLAKSQNPDGSWGAKNPGRLTAQIALVFRASSHFRDSNPYGKNVVAALTYLITSSPEDRDTQALRICALAENQIVRPDESLSLPLQSALRKLIEGKAETDSAQTLAATCRAYEVAYQAGCREAGLVEAYHATLTRLKALALSRPADPDSRAAIFYALAAAGLAWGADDKILPELEPLAPKFFQELIKSPDWSQIPSLGTCSRATYAAFEQGGDEWRNCRQKIEPTLRKNQQAEGFWNPPGVPEPSLDQRLEATALACQMLEVYYAYKHNRFIKKEAAAAAEKKR